MSDYTLSGKELYRDFRICLPSKWGSTLNGKNLLLNQQILCPESRSLFIYLFFLKYKRRDLLGGGRFFPSYCNTNNTCTSHIFRTLKQLLLVTFNSVYDSLYVKKDIG